MASGRHCDECRRLTVLYFESVRHHASLMEEKHDTLHEDAGDIKWKLLQAERCVNEARENFIAHRATHFSKQPTAGGGPDEGGDGSGIGGGP
jgi:hypothetical protein